MTTERVIWYPWLAEMPEALVPTDVMLRTLLWWVWCGECSTWHVLHAGPPGVHYYHSPERRVDLQDTYVSCISFDTIGRN